MSKIIVPVLPLEDQERVDREYPNRPIDSNTTSVRVHDPKKVVETLKAQPEAPGGIYVLVSNFYPESMQNEIKADVESNFKDVQVIVVPLGLKDLEVKEFLQTIKDKGGESLFVFKD